MNQRHHRTLGARHAAALGVLAALLATTTGCGERKLDEKKAVNFVDKNKVDYSQVKVAPPPKAEPEEAKPDTWAADMQGRVAAVHEALTTCRNDFMIPFQFRKMARRDVMWLNIGQFDAICRDGDKAKKLKSPWKMTKVLRDDELGKHPELDAFILAAIDSMEHARVVSYMTKKVGAPNIDRITEVAQRNRDVFLAVGTELDRAAKAIAGWSSKVAPLNDPARVGKPVSLASYVADLGAYYGWLIPTVAERYGRFGASSWDSPDLVKRISLKLMDEMLAKRLAFDRKRLVNVEGADDKAKEALTAYLDAATAVHGAYAEAYPPYLKKDSEIREDDPARKPIEKAAKAFAEAAEAVAKLAPADAAP